jgi:hypothetical protein
MPHAAFLYAAGALRTTSKHWHPALAGHSNRRPIGPPRRSSQAACCSSLYASIPQETYRSVSLLWGSPSRATVVPVRAGCYTRHSRSRAWCR